ncbi:MAG: NAD(P)/FAD-dependent oxidoreductase [Chloroflexi bacterium]|nr:NAD(P)/FAD-dependent oxidoreductase [Chloroflexota bacterium]
MMERRKRVVILGAGAAGFTAAMEFQRASSIAPGLEVVLVDQQNYHLFQPLLYQVVTGSIDPSHICYAVRSSLRHGGNTGAVIFRESKVHGIDISGKRVITDNGEMAWDYLMVALGSTTNYFGMEGIEGHTVPLKSMRDAINMHNHILDRYEKALLEADEQRRRELLTFVVVGAGATGVELTASIQDYVRKVLVRVYPSITPLARVILVEAHDRILYGMQEGLTRVALRRLQTLGVEVLLGTRIVRVSAEGVQTSDGRTIPTGTVIWVAGVRPVPVVAALPFEKARDSRFLVNQYMEVPEAPGVYILGDCASLSQISGEPYPPTGQVAVRQGRACARSIINDFLGRPGNPFRYKYKGELIAMGRNVAMAQVGKLAFDGFPAWVLWRMYYLAILMGFRSKLSVALDWSLAYFYHRNTARLE